MPFGFREGQPDTSDLNVQEVPQKDFVDLPDDSGDTLYQVDLPNDSGEDIAPQLSDEASQNVDNKERELPERMEQVVIKFKYPENADDKQKKEFNRQLKAQERGLNSQSVAENMKNRQDYQLRKSETGSGRLPEAGIAQQRAREKAVAQRIQSNQKKGMSYGEAKEEADNWIQTQAALHNPDQIAGGNPLTVSRMGDKNINSSIGGQWSPRVTQLAEAVDKFAQSYSKAELKRIKMNVKLEVE